MAHKVLKSGVVIHAKAIMDKYNVYLLEHDEFSRVNIDFPKEQK